MSNDTTDPLYNAQWNFGEIQEQVSKVTRGYGKNSFDMQGTLKKWIKKPYISIPMVFFFVLIILWLLDLGFIKNEENQTSIIKLFLWTAGLTIGVWLPLYFFWIRTLS